MRYAIISAGPDHAFSDCDAFIAGAVSTRPEIVIHCGTPHEEDGALAAVLVELGRECLGVHTGEADGDEGSNAVGFARYRNGAEAPSNLIELVRQPRTAATAIDAAEAMFREAGFAVATCADQPGRIVDRLVRPKYNAALRFLDEGLASREDIDATCRLGLGYPLGPIERVSGGGLADHFAVSDALHRALGHSGYVPARRAAVAYRRERPE